MTAASPSIPRAWLTACHPRWAPAFLALGGIVPLLGLAAAWASPQGALLLVAALAVAVLGIAALLLLVRRPWLAPWLVVPVFSLSGELRLRVSPQVGLAKDGILLLLVAVTTVIVWNNRSAVARRLRSYAAPLGALAVLVALYLGDAAGAHRTPWLFGTRLLLSVLALLVIGMVAMEPLRWVRALVGALAVVLPVEALFAWAQQAAGIDRLVYRWGYAYGSQVRVTSDGGLRTSGTFEDPFQLAALAIIGLAVALFVARGRVAVLIGLSSVLVLGAASVRTTWIQAAILILCLVIKRGFWKQAAVAGIVVGAAGLLVLATTTTSIRPGAPEEPLLLTLNGRSVAWANAVTGWGSLAYGNGVGALGIGSTRDSTTVSAAPAYDPNSAPEALFAGDPAFLDSAYAQVLSDVGVVGVAALAAGFGGLSLAAYRRLRAHPGNGAAWAAGGLLVVSAVDWVGRASLASFSTGYLTMFVIGVLVAAMGTGPHPRPDPGPVARPRRTTVRTRRTRRPMLVPTRAVHPEATYAGRHRRTP